MTLLMEGAAEAVSVDDLWALWTLTLSWLRDWARPPARRHGSGDIPPAAAGTGAAGPTVGDGVDTVIAGELVARVEGHAATAGDLVALDDGRHRLRYRDLAALARTARERLGWGPGHLVGIAGSASARYFAVAYAVLAAGATYLPLPTGRPDRPVADTARRAGCHVVVDLDDPGGPDGQGALAAELPGTPVVGWDHLTGAAPPPTLGEGRRWSSVSAPAYVIYTSGSTGTPKGVVVGRPALDRLAAWTAETLDLAPGTVVAQTANVGFDASVFEVWPALHAGARAMVSPAEVRRDPYLLAEWLTEHRIDVAFLPTPMAETVSALRTPPSCLRIMYTGGDRLHPVPENLPYRMLNCYGPTEVTVLCTAGWVRPGGTELPPIGRTLPYAYLRVVGPEGGRRADGVTGELWVGGAGLAEGYLDDPLLTAARFVIDPYGDGVARVYRTGDLVRVRPDGELDFIGREDRQIQVGGVRTELGELEAVALRVAGVRQAVATAAEGARARLWLYVQAQPGTDLEDLARRVREAMPPHVRHLAVECVDAIPLTTNGKVDLEALRRLSRPHRDDDPSSRSPSSLSPSPDVAPLLPALASLSSREALLLASRLIDSVIQELPQE